MTTINTHHGKNINWTVYKNGYNSFVCALLLNDEAYDISGLVFKMYFRRPNSSENVLVLTEGDGLTNGGELGTLTVVLTSEQLATLVRDRYFLVIEYTVSSKTYPILQGYLQIKDETNPEDTTTSVTIPVNVEGASLQMDVRIGVGVAAGEVVFSPSGNITSNNVQDAIEELDSEKQASLGFTPENTANKGQANGYASLDSAGQVPSGQLPSYVDDVLEFADLASFPAEGETGKIYVAIDSNLSYRWSGSVYVLISSVPADATDSVKGIAKLYNSVDGSNTDGAPTQASIKTALAKIKNKMYVGGMGLA